ncbi:protein archease isoform X1 [Neoarius graeffei]|uniref:protein archease isoform X1 n=1 Tax=Neoarius graeffei TaxID=443677 RepID=UPI00298BF7F2|nr:protein archease isoform X1 [Neoarius graeffei]
MNDRELDLTETQKAIKAKYPAINKKYEYLDHTADVQLHSWGDSLEEAFEQCAMAMFGYMTDTETVEPIDTIEVESEGQDLESLLFHFLDDWLFKFSADVFFIPRLGGGVQPGKTSTRHRSESYYLLGYADMGQRKTRDFRHHRHLIKKPSLSLAYETHVTQAF